MISAGTVAMVIYEIREFASMALFFRRYAKDVLGYPNGNDNLLAHLRPGAAVLGNGYAGTTNDWLGDNVDTVDLNMTYMGESWTPALNWNFEYGAHGPGWDGGYTNWLFYAGSTAQYPYRTEDVYIGADNARDTEVWFIDAGPYAGTAYDYTGNGDFKWSDMGRFEEHTSSTLASYNVMQDPNYVSLDVLAIDNPNTDADNINLNKGIVNNTAANTHSMNLAFGGIKGAADSNESPGFFNIGNWNTSTGAANNTNYPDLDDFVTNFNSGIQFRWKQDPTQQIYTIGGNIQSNGQVRHSSILHDHITGYAGSVSPYVWQELGATSMAELLSFNFTKNWKLNDISPSYDGKWNPLFDGKIPDSLEITLTICDSLGAVTGVTATGSNVGEDLKIFVTDIVGTSNYTDNTTLKVGMAFSKYTRQTNITTHVFSDISNLNSSPAGINDFLVIRRIEALVNSAGTTYYALTLGGYREPLRAGEHRLASNNGNYGPKINTGITFVQVGMNGYSPNSEFNINTIAHATTSKWGAVTAVGYDIEFIEYVEPEEILSENPAIFETEPKELPKLDIYYEASADIPMMVDAETISSAFTVGSTIIFLSGLALQAYYVVGHLGDLVLVKSDPAPASYQAAFGGITNVTILRHDGVTFKHTIQNVTDLNVGGVGSVGAIKFDPQLFNLTYSLPWYNCFSFRNGVESNRIRDAYNLPYITNGVKVSTTLEYDYKEEHRKHGLIYSGLYNSTSGVNNLNQFIQAEKITKDINPIYGSIQKLHARDEDLVAFCEDKVLKILSQKDALYNADGNINLTATERVLGQAIPFAGEYGISTNPESFASENYRVYFADRVRGAVLRLSMDGLTPISDYGMKDWFRDNLKLVKDGKIIGSYDDRNDEYVLKLEFLDFNYGGNNYNIAGCTDPTASNYDANATIDDGSCLVCIYGCTNPSVTNYDPGATCDDGSCNVQTSVYGCTDPTALNYNALAVYNNGSCTYDVYGCMDQTACNYNPLATVDNGTCIYHAANANCQGACLPGYVLVNGVCVACVYGCTTPNDPNYLPAATCDDGSCTGVVYIYGCMDASATNYDASAAVTMDNNSCTWAGCIDPTATNYSAAIVNNAMAYGTAATNDGSCTYNIPGCTDPTAINYSAAATVDDGTCTYAITGCTNPLATNYNALATVDDGTCTYPTVSGCTNPLATNYNPLATVDDGTCTYAITGCTIDSNGNIVIPDVNFKAYLVGNTAINTNGDTEISVTEAAAVLLISAPGKAIFDLTGIACFTALKNLNVNTNGLTSIDVSQNTHLGTLRVAGNSLTSLNVTQNIYLERLQCNINNLTSLNLSQNAQLVELHCYGNPLTNLNIQNGNNNNMPDNAAGFLATLVPGGPYTGTSPLIINSDSGGPTTLNGLYNYINVPGSTTWI
jgi:hypothetical protein